MAAFVIKPGPPSIVHQVVRRALAQDIDTVYLNFDNLAPSRPNVADADANDLNDFQLPAGLGNT